MTDTSNNPQAYPCLDSSGYGLSMRDPGMTLRDYFAGQALIAMGTWSISNVPLFTADADIWAARARAAYEQADAMLKARKLDD